MLILGIETSFDETGIAIYDNNKGLIANKIHSQTKIHSNYGGVVPELAARNHVKNIIPLIKKTLKISQLSIKDINVIAYTAGPGLVGSLLVGATTAFSLSYGLKIPIIPIHHMEGHLLSPMLEKNKPIFPFIALLISGGHTQLIDAHKLGDYKLLGETIDDAVGEAFDKVANLLGIKYPGGANLEKMARKGELGKFIFPSPMINDESMNFSFSGLKTSVTNVISKNIFNQQDYYDIALAFENAVIDVLIKKSLKALNITGYKQLVIAGGVSANKSLRFKLNKILQEKNKKLFFPRKKFCTDNAAMIAYTGMLKLKNNLQDVPIKKLDIQIFPKWNLHDIYY